VEAVKRGCWACSHFDEGKATDLPEATLYPVGGIAALRLASRRVLVTAARVRVLLADGAVLLLDDVLDTAVDGHTTTVDLGCCLRLVGAARSLVTLGPIFPATVFVVGLNVAFTYT
jgi:hypothetical protein